MKIIIVGPQQSGKTTIANILAEHSEGITPGYKPTRGVRYLIQSLVEFWSLKKIVQNPLKKEQIRKCR